MINTELSDRDLAQAEFVGLDALDHPGEPLAGPARLEVRGDRTLLEPGHTRPRLRQAGCEAGVDHLAVVRWQRVDHYLEGVRRLDAVDDRLRPKACDLLDNRRAAADRGRSRICGDRQTILVPPDNGNLESELDRGQGSGQADDAVTDDGHPPYASRLNPR